MNHDLSAQYWNTRYVQNDFGWDLGEISRPLKTYFDQLINKKISILIPGAGNSYEAEYLFDKGFKNVYVCDFAREPLGNLKKRRPDFSDDKLLHNDFFDLKNLSFDLIIEQTFFCALHPSLRNTYFKKMHELLRPGSKLVGLLFDDVLNSHKPPFGGNKEEYLNQIDHNAFKIKTFEKAYNSVEPRKERELFINLVRL